MWGRDARDPRLFVRTHGHAGSMLELLRRTMVSVDPEVHIGQESTLAGRTEMRYQRERLLASMLVLTFAAAIAALATFAVAAGILPARRVARIDPAVALRLE